MPTENISFDRVLHYFDEICKIPHGSGNMEKISEYCVEFAKKHNLKFHKDNACNVIIYKPSQNPETLILQGHLDMVCQKNVDTEIDFLSDSIKTYIDGDFLKAKGTTLGADNGIAVAFILAVLESEINLPCIEAVFTTDEEIGMIGASRLDTSLLKAKKMINIDSEDDNILTVSCAGGSDFVASLPLSYTQKSGYETTIILQGLKGGHSGIEIDKNRVNANILAGRVLHHLNKDADFDIISINGGDKSNAITNRCEIKLCCNNIDSLQKSAKDYLSLIKTEISAKEPGFSYSVELGKKSEYSVISNKHNIINILLNVPNGVIDMSAEIDGLVETSLNLGILKTENENICFQFALRSNKQTALDFLEERLTTFFKTFGCNISIGGKYPTWEFKENSSLQKLYIDTYFEQTGEKPKVEAIHAGLECAVFSNSIKGLDCIAIGPTILDAHTTAERLNLTSAKKIFNILVKCLKKYK